MHRKQNPPGAGSGVDSGRWELLVFIALSWRKWGFPPRGLDLLAGPLGRQGWDMVVCASHTSLVGREPLLSS